MHNQWLLTLEAIATVEKHIETFLSAEEARVMMPNDDLAFKELWGRVTKTYPTMMSRWSWWIERVLSRHILIRLHNNLIMEDSPCPVVWSEKNYALWELNSLEKFTQIVLDEGLNLSDNLSDIVAIFCFFQVKKRILQSSMDLQNSPISLMIADEKQSRLAKYLKLVEPLTFFEDDHRLQAKFWTIDIATGDLEEWLFVQSGSAFQVQPLLNEKGFIRPIMQR